MTHARPAAARGLGDERVTLDADEHHDPRGQRGINGVPGLKVPGEVIPAPGARSMPRGTPIPRAERLAETDGRISTQDHAASRGRVPYDRLACNVHRLWRRPRVMAISRVMPLAQTCKPTASQMDQNDHPSVVTRHGTLTGLAGTVDRGTTQTPRGARGGGMARRGQQQATLADQPTRVVPRLVAQPGA
jgi:hypothetical protein